MSAERRTEPGSGRLRRARAPFALLLAALVLTSGPGVPVARGADVPRHWMGDVMVVRDHTGLPEHGDALRHAASDWNAGRSRVRLEVAPGEGAGCPDPAAGEVVVCRHTFTGGRLGEAQVWGPPEHVVRAAIWIDDRPLPAERLRAVTCHELGHALGLGHSDRGGSCLHPEARDASPDEVDLHELRRRHDHDDPKEPCPRPALLRVGGVCVGYPGSGDSAPERHDHDAH